MKRAISLAAAALLAAAFAGGAFAQIPEAGWAPAGSPVDKYGQLKTSTNRIQSTKTNADLQLKGMSLFWSSDIEYSRKFWNERVIARLANEWRVSVVRAAMGASTKDDGYTYLKDKSGNRSAVDRVIKGAVEQGIYVIVDWHSHYADDTDEKKEAIAFFKEIAKDYKDYPNIIYEIFNEPLGSGAWDSRLKKYSEELIDSIRTIDTKNLILVPTANWCQEITAPVGNKIGGGRTNIAYVTHFYCDHGFGSDVTNAAKSIPIFASEIGYSSSSGNGTCSNSASSLDSWLSTLKSDSISWAAWALTNKEETASAIKYYARSNTTDNPRLGEGKWRHNDEVTTSGKYFYNQLRGTSPGTDRKYKLTITPVGTGTVSGAGEYDLFTSVKLEAKPGSGMRFEGWVINGSPVSNNPLDLGEVYFDRTGTAQFFTDNILKNSTFTLGAANWTFATGVGVMGGGRVVDGAYKCSVGTANASNNRNGRLNQINVALTGGRKYKLSFKARAVTAAGMKITPVVASTAGTNYSKDTAAVTLTTAWKEESLTFDMTSPTTDVAVVAFYCGAQAGEWLIDDIALVDVGPGTPVGRTSAFVASPFRASFNGRALVLSGAAGKRADVTVFDMAGRVRMSRSVALSGSAHIQLDRLPAGVYTVRYKVDGAPAGRSERIALAR